jgi:ribose transport system ATP-binding protein
MLVELMMGRTVEKIDRIRSEADGPVVLEVQDLESGPLRGIDISIRSGEMVGIAGLLGSGRSTLLKALFGLIPLDAGTIELDGKPLQDHTPNEAMAAGIAYVPEDRAKDAAFSELEVKENLSVTVVPSYWRGGVLNQRREARDSRGLFKLFMITAESERSPLRSLSGGNQQKVILARWLRRQPRILLLDEPTQGVDVAARAEIYELVHRAVAGGAAALLASSDLEELAAVCDRVVVLRKGTLVGEVAGSELDADRLTQLANAEVAVA